MPLSCREPASVAACCEPPVFAACCPEPVALRAFGGVAISASPLATRGAFPFPAAVAGEVPQFLLSRIQDAFRLVLGAALLHAADEFRQALLVLGDVEPVDGFSEPQVG